MKTMVQLLIDDQILNKYKTICYNSKLKFDDVIEESMQKVILKWKGPVFKEEWLKSFRK